MWQIKVIYYIMYKFGVLFFYLRIISIKIQNELVY